jgi:hypothetical protein
MGMVDCVGVVFRAAAAGIGAAGTVRELSYGQISPGEREVGAMAFVVAQNDDYTNTRVAQHICAWFAVSFAPSRAELRYLYVELWYAQAVPAPAGYLLAVGR